MICIGIDPGKSGAAVALRDGKMKICRFDKDTEQDVAKWLEAIDTAAAKKAPMIPRAVRMLLVLRPEA